MKNTNILKNGLLIGILAIPMIAISQSSIIYKCIDSENNTVYHNKSTMGGLKCAATDLASIDPARKEKKEINNDIVKALSSPTKTINIPSMAVPTSDTKEIAKPRNPILEKELLFESNQLKTVESMLKNAQDLKDQKQSEQLIQMKNIHTKNIEALNKELGIKIDVELMVKPEVPKSMPVNY